MRNLSAESITYITTKTFEKALQNATLSGGQAQKRAKKVRVVLGSLSDPDLFAGLPVTNHGEDRIRNCVKYDLGDGWRLVTQQTEKTCIFLFVGDHEDTDRWLNSHRGETFGVKDGRICRIPGAGNDLVPRRNQTVDQHARPLVSLLDDDAMDYVLEGLPRSMVRKIEALDGAASSYDIDNILSAVSDAAKADFIRNVFRLLLKGDVDGARAHVDLSRGHISPVEEIDAQDMVDVLDGAEVRRLRVGSPDYETWLKEFEKRSSWHDWFLFLHPEQEKVVKAEYSGGAQLSGVSGSGKTCVVVRRAMRLAEANGARVLILTLNRSLAGLLRQLADAACVDEIVRSRIEVSSFFELAQTLLRTFEPENARHYQDVTWKLGEHVDEVFREYYRCWANNHDAAVLLPLQKSFNARGVNGETYVREEFDWIRSAVPPNDRAEYVQIERKGRRFGILADHRREMLLPGLIGWEQKMRAVGVVDYLGLTSALTRHLDKIVPSYTHILVDEAQDFGTTELRIVRRLVHPGSNDIFLCGDVAQTVLPKHRDLPEAGIVLVARERIQQNYRNSREILGAAYDLLTKNLHEELFESGDLEVLDPHFANFGGSVPVALAADTLEEEIAYARAYAATRLQRDVRTVCIAFAGFSSRDVGEFARTCGVRSLDGAYDPLADQLVFSDLEQTKGYEFDTLIVVGCCEGVLPARDAPQEEAFRDLCKLYVAMTRAKRELILSFHGPVSPWIKDVSNTILADDWSSWEKLDHSVLQGVPKLLPEVDPNAPVHQTMSLTGPQFIYTSQAMELSVEAQDKITEVVDGRGLSRGGGGPRLKWATMAALIESLHESRRHDTLLGPKVSEELRAKLPRRVQAPT